MSTASDQQTDGHRNKSGWRTQERMVKRRRRINKRKEEKGEGEGEGEENADE